MPRLEVFKSKKLLRAQKWFYRLVADNGKKMYQSEPYPSKYNAERGAADAKQATTRADIRTV